MINAKDALLTLIKSVDGTMQAAKFEITSNKTPEDTSAPITYAGEYGEVELKFEDNVLFVNCKAEGTEVKTVAQTLFDLNDETWDDMATKSAANVVCEAVGTYFGTEIVFAGKASKTNNTAKNGKNGKGAMTPEIEEFLDKGKKAKEARKNAPSYDAMALALKMENIFQELKGEAEKNQEKYEDFLVEEYFGTLVTPKILECIKLSDRQNLKKIFNVFNTFYEEGDNDIQSLIVVSVLGMNLAKDEELLDKCESYMEDNLHDAVLPVVKYLKTGSAKKRKANFENPTPKLKTPKKKLL